MIVVAMLTERCDLLMVWMNSQ